MDQANLTKAVAEKIRELVEAAGRMPAFDKKPGSLCMMDYKHIAREVVTLVQQEAPRNPCADLPAPELSPLRGLRTMESAPTDGSIIRVRLGFTDRRPGSEWSVAWYNGDPVYPWSVLDRQYRHRPFVAKITERAFLGWTPLGEPAPSSGDRAEAELWRALIGCARMTTMGWAGFGPSVPPDTTGYRHLTLNLWTQMHEGYDPAADKPAAEAREKLVQFAEVAAALAQRLPPDIHPTLDDRLRQLQDWMEQCAVCLQAATPDGDNPTGYKGPHPCDCHHFGEDAAKLVGEFVRAARGLGPWPDLSHPNLQDIVEG